MLTVYTTDTCAYCPMVKQYLKHKNVEFVEVNVSNDQETRSKLFNATGMLTVPVVSNGTDYVVGYNPANLSKLIG